MDSYHWAATRGRCDEISNAIPKRSPSAKGEMVTMIYSTCPMVASWKLILLGAAVENVRKQVEYFFFRHHRQQVHRHWRNL